MRENHRNFDDNRAFVARLSDLVKRTSLRTKSKGVKNNRPVGSNYLGGFCPKGHK